MRTVAVLLLILAMPSPTATAPQDAGGSLASRRVIRGQVRSDDDSAALLRRVRVDVSGAPETSVFTDREGRFELAVSGSGSFTLRLTKPGFAPQEVASTRLPPDDQLQIRMTRGAAIVGRIIDEAGAPAVDVGVRVRSIPAGDVVPVSALTRTDDLGEFRVGSLPAGRYEAAVDEGTLMIITITPQGDGVSMRATVAPPPPLPASPPPPQPAFAVIDTAGPVLPPSQAVIELGSGEEVGVVLVHEAGPPAVRSATSYAAGFEAGSADVRDLATALRRSGGTAVVTGRVTGPNGRTVPGAIVRLNPVTPGPPPRVAPSGSDGAFQFTEVVAGTYQVAVTRNGFIAGEYGQARAGQAGSVVTLRDRQRLDRLDLVLHRGAVVTGTVSDGDGEPLEGIAMQVWQARSRDGRQVADVVADVPLRRTDDRGRYRIHGLQPGSYYVVASEDSGPPPNGRVLGLRGAPRVFYPAASSPAAASVVHVDAGLDATGADLTFDPAPTFRISGYALDSEGEPVSWPVALRASGRGGAVVTPPQSAPVDAEGAFEFTHVPPGHYVMQAFQLAGRELALGYVEVTDGDVGPVRLTAAQPSSISGRIVVKGGPSDAAVTNVRIDVLPADPDYLSQNAVPRPWVFSGPRGGTFELGGLFGALRFVTAATPAGWWLESVNIGGINAADEPVTFAGPGDSRAGVEVVLSNNGAEISGRVVDDRNDPIGTFVAVAFPVDRERWYTGSRYVKTAPPDAESRFRLQPLPPGDYWVAAVDTLPEAALQDIDWLTKLSTLARRVTISAGQRLVADVPLSRVQK